MAITCPSLRVKPLTLIFSFDSSFYLFLQVAEYEDSRIIFMKICNPNLGLDFFFSFNQCNLLFILLKCKDFVYVFNINRILFLFSIIQLLHKWIIYL
jgi:hypothetical protein